MLVPYDPRWPEQFRAAADEILAATGAGWVTEHIGSTAVPGLAAKPVIDLAVRTDRLSEIEDHRDALASIGFVGVAGGPRTHQVLVRASRTERTHLAHFFAARDWDACNQRIFRDWLRDHPDDRLRYEQVKRSAAAASTGGRAYTARKTAIIQEIVDRARTALGLPRVDVWEK